MKMKFFKAVSGITAIVMGITISASAVGKNRTENTNGWEKTSPKENVFAIEGDPFEFVLLDELEEGFLVLSDKSIGRGVFDPDNTGKFDIEDENNIAYWLNNDYINGNSGNFTPLPQPIIDALVERDWLTEAGHESTDINEDYTVRCKVALMSATEWYQYHWTERKIGSMGVGYWYLRTTDSTGLFEGEYASGILVGAENGITAGGKAASGASIRPIFVLDKDFFKTNRVNVAKTGGNVLQMIRNSISEAELKKLYNNNNILTKFEKYSLPSAKGVVYQGITIEGRTLYGSYTFGTTNGLPEKGTKLRWLRSNTKDGNYSVIPGANQKSYTLTKKDVGKYIKFEVIPKTAKNIGYAARSDAWYISAESTPEAYDVRINGKPVCGSELYISYHWKDENNEPASNTYYSWQISDDGVNFKNIEGADEQALTPDDSYAGRYLRAGVQMEKLGDGSYPKGDWSYSEPVQIRQISKVAVTAELTGDILSGRYTYNDAENIANDDTEYYWEISDEEDGKYVVLAKASKTNILSGDKSYYARFVAIPKSDDGIVGDAVKSQPLKISAVQVEAKQLPKVSTASSKKIALGKNMLACGIVLEIETSAQTAEFKSSLFDVMWAKTKTGYLVSLTPKNAGTAYAGGAVLETELSGEAKLKSAKARFVGADASTDITNSIGFTQ